MTAGFGKRATYRVRQFGQALRARWRGPDERELAQARCALPDAGWRLLRDMPRSDQVHALKVWAAVKLEGVDDVALAQAALLHDVAKHMGGVTLLHRVVVVLLKAFSPAAWQRLTTSPEPSRRSLRYPLWTHANHPETSAQLAAAAGCKPQAVSLIRRHQDRQQYQDAALPRETRAREDALLLVLQRADDDN